MNDLTPEEYEMLRAILDRVQVSGDQAEVYVSLRKKLLAGQKEERKGDRVQ